MAKLIKSIRVLNVMSIILFLVCCYYMCVSSEHPPGALTVVEDVDDDNGDVTVENGDSEEKIDPLDVFYPTKDWKTVKQGQAIPAGLHVRLNLETGQREAKLMEGDEGHKYWKSGDKEGMVNTDSQEFTHEELKKALKEFKATIHDIPDEKRAKEIKEKFRSYAELKEDFKMMNMGIKTGQEIVTELYEKLNSTNITSDQRELVLSDLEYHLHQYDNAVLFCDLGGMSLLVQGLNYTDPSLRSLSAFALGAAVQSNPKVKIYAVESGALHQLIRSLATDASIEVKKKAMFALSSMIRDFPFAQKKFFEQGGLQSMMQLFKDDKLGVLQVKVVTLMSDLTEEQLHWLNQLEPSEEKYKQYNEVPIKDSIYHQGLCDSLVPLLVSMPDHDSREKIVSAMLALFSTCEPSLYNTLSYLERIEKEYLTLAVGEEEGDFFHQIHKKINSLIQEIHLKHQKVEL